jgi:murein DD-endopeptidase MepM/ murein hydrolase activator NlpD
MEEMPRRLTQGTILFAAGLLLVSACSKAEVARMESRVKMPSFALLKKEPDPEPAPIEKYGQFYYGDPEGRPLSRAESDRKRERRLYKTVLVRKGDTIYQIAERYNLESRDIIEYNHLKAPYALTAGTSLRLPRAQFYDVQVGDSLYEISRMKGVDTSRLASLNSLKAPYAIKPGMRLRLPFSTYASGEDYGAEANGGIETGQVEVAELEPRPFRKKIPRAETYAPRKLRYRSDAQQAADRAADNAPLEQSSSQGDIEVADLPAPITAPVPSRVEEPSEPESPASLRPEPRKHVVQPYIAPPEETAPVAEPAGTSPEHFSWPVKGKILAAFGPKRGGVYNDGINIAAPVGTNVKAAADGVVIYAGDGLEGYGNLVIVKHSGGWITSYAHNREILVKRGTKVRRGQVLAKVGETGRVSKPQLHFGLRHGRKVMDPLQYLSS